MSIGIPVDRLRAEQAKFHTAPYCLTVDDEGRPHGVAVTVTWRDDRLVVPAGNRTLANARERPLVSVLWPPNDVGGYSLIVDATVTAAHGTGEGDNEITLEPTRAVLHRPRAENNQPSGSACAADCAPLTD